MARRRILIVCPEPIGRIRTGVGIRLSELARQLQAVADVTLAAPAVEEGLGFPFRLLSHSPPSLAQLVGECDVAIVHGHVSNEVLDAEPEVPLVFDLYDPFLVENLAYAEELGPAVHRYDRMTLERQLGQGDFFLVASAHQRAFYLGALAMLGRVNPGSYGKGRTLDHLVATVPFGVPDPEQVPLPERTGRWREQLGLKDEPLVFFGGIYDWYDPLIALEALERVRSELPKVRLLLVRNPREETTPQTLFGRTLQAAEERGLGENLVISDWIPYEERGVALADADLGLVSHRPGIETELSFRTRVLDFLWAGLPVVSSAGGAGSDLVARAEAGRLVAPGDGSAMADAILALLTDEPARERASARGRDYVLEHHVWSRVVEPLRRWLEEPAVDHHKPKPDSSSPRPSLWALLRGRR